MSGAGETMCEKLAGLANKGAGKAGLFSKIPENGQELFEHLRAVLVALGEDPDREGLLDTPSRIIKSWNELYAGYNDDPATILSKSFQETEGYDQIVLLKDIPFFSTCEHHMLAFTGFAHVGYLVTEKAVGISKLARLVDCHARRLQIQERMTRGIALDIMAHLQPAGVGVVVVGQHLCMQARGVKKAGAVMVTSAMEGSFKHNEGGCKDEFYQMVNLAG